MEYQKKLSKLRHLVLKVQGQDLQQVLLRAAAQRAEEVVISVHNAEEVFHVVSEKIYEHTNEMSWDEAYNIVSDSSTLAKLKNDLIEKTVEPFEWDETLEVILDGFEDTERKTLEVVLENQRMHVLAESAASGSTAVHDLARFRKLLVPIVAKIFRNFEARKLIGVQPMNGPVGLTYLLRYRQLDEDGKYEEADIDGDGVGGKKITLDIISKAVEASSRTLKAGWTIEAMQDLNALHGLDLESEMSQAIAAEIQDEITAEIVNNLRKLAGDPIKVELDGFDSNAPINLGIHINSAANDIARKTRRGAGNWVVVPHTIVSMFESGLPASVYKKKEGGKFGLFGSLMEVGTLNGTIKVFSSLTLDTDEILVGYKGNNGECDTGYVYAPYIPVMTSGVVVDSETFQPVIKLMTRAGMTLNGDFQHDEEGNKIDKPPKAQNYYNLIKIKGNLFTETESSNDD